MAARLAILRFFFFRANLQELADAHLRSGARRFRGVAVSPMPEFRIEAGLFRTMILERLRLPLQASEARECGAFLDREGTEPTQKRVQAPARCQEAGATLRYNARLRDVSVAVAAQDDKAIDVSASSLLHVILRCTHSGWTAQPGAARVDGAVCSRAWEEQERTCSELVRGDGCRLVVVALEMGGRRSRFSSSKVLGATRAMLHMPCSALPHGADRCLSQVRWWVLRCLPSSVELMRKGKF